MGIGLYIHIPFCKQKCNYCDFNSGPFRPADLDQYMELIETEAKLYLNEFGKMAVETIFIGGGTPTVLEPNHINHLGRVLKSTFDLTQLKEFTFEANPESVTEEKAEAFRAIGANRVSVGLQTANDAELFAISRIHDWQTFLDAFRTLRKAGFDNINIDLMIGLPGQTQKSYLESLRKVLALEPEHISNYGLILEEETPLFKLVNGGLATVLDGDEERDLYHQAVEILKEYGYDLYEISNFSKGGKHCFHNINYWRCGEYVALGVGAHGYLKGERYENAETITDYKTYLNLNQRPLISRDAIDIREQEREYLMLALRMAEGVKTRAYEALFGKDPMVLYQSVLKRYEQSGHLKCEEGCFYLTIDGMDISNTIIIDFFECLDEMEI